MPKEILHFTAIESNYSVQIWKNNKPMFTRNTDWSTEARTIHFDFSTYMPKPDEYIPQPLSSILLYDANEQCFYSLATWLNSNTDDANQLDIVTKSEFLQIINLDIGEVFYSGTIDLQLHLIRVN